jgi:(p)ppGpp synthase/HD superfamily hydrolase
VYAPGRAGSFNPAGAAVMDYLQKNTIALRYWLIAKEYYRALKAMELASSYHTGTRKDGITPEFSHQLLMALYVKTLYKYLLFPEDTFITIFGHDLIEDYDVEEWLLRDFCVDKVKLVTKRCKLYTKDLPSYYAEIGKDSVASVVKAADRMHNVQSMPGVFDKKRQLEYITETEMYVLPMIKVAKRLFPEQEPFYENVKLCIRNQIALIKLIS